MSENTTDELAEAEGVMRAIKAPGETVTLEGPLLQEFMAEYDRRGEELERLHAIKQRAIDLIEDETGASANVARYVRHILGEA